MTHDKPDWIDRCTARTGLLLVCLSAAVFAAGVIVACGVVA